MNASGVRVTFRRNRTNSSRYSSAHTLRVSSPNRGSQDPKELLNLLWQLTTPRTALTKEPRTWTVRDQRAALRSFNQRISAIRDTPLWTRGDFQTDLRPLRDAATGRISAVALQYAFADLKAFADKWFTPLSRELHRKLNANTASVLKR